MSNTFQRHQDTNTRRFETSAIPLVPSAFLNVFMQRILKELDLPLPQSALGILIVTVVLLAACLPEANPSPNPPLATQAPPAPLGATQPQTSTPPRRRQPQLRALPDIPIPTATPAGALPTCC